jgi:hypothetical protein
MKPELKKKQLLILKKLRSAFGIKALDNIELNNIGKRFIGSNFCGVYAYDQYPIHKEDCTYSIINTDNSRQPGTHWIGVYKKDKTLYIFDSFGRFSKNILKKFVKSHVAEGYKIVDINRTSDQGNDQQDCGLRCITTLLLIKKYGINAVFD